MKTKKVIDNAPKLSGEQIVNKKLKEINALLKGADFTNLPKRPNVNG